jgi:DNA-binding FrmR family transcriptional regulator
MTTERQNATIAIKKASGLLEKIKKMLDDNAYCIDIMQQNLAVIGLLKSAHQSLLEGHLNSCVSGAITTGSPAKKKQLIDEVIRVSKLASK